MASREELDKEYVEFAVKLNDRHMLKANLGILEQYNLEIFEVSDRLFFIRQFVCKVRIFGFVVLKLCKVLKITFAL